MAYEQWYSVLLSYHHHFTIVMRFVYHKLTELPCMLRKWQRGLLLIFTPWIWNKLGNFKLCWKLRIASGGGAVDAAFSPELF